MKSQKTILVVYAHPDDGVILSGGSLIKWVKEGHHVYVLSATSGDLGTKDINTTREKVAETRERELVKAMELIGGNPPIFLKLPDGFLQNHTEELKERLVFWIRKLKSDRIITFDPWLRYEVHPDHRTIGQIASEAATFACFPLLYPNHLQEGLQPHQPEELWYLFPHGHRPNRLVDISDELDQKIEAMLCLQTSIEIIADLFLPEVDPRNLSEADKIQLNGAADNFLRMTSQGLASLSEGKVEFAEAFYALKIGAGHFYNFQEMFQETIGMPPDPLVIC